MDTGLLRSFLAVAQRQSFTGAADELGFTQSTVTGHVQKLERRLGTLLLDRLPTGVVATEAGARLVPHAEQVLAAEDRLHDSLRGGVSRPSGTVRVTAPESLCTYRLPGIVRAVQAAEPGVRVWITPGGVRTGLEAVRRGAADLALVLESREPVTDLAQEHLGREPLVVLDNAAAPGPAATWADLARRDALLVEEGCSYSDDVVLRLAATDETAGRRSRFGSVEAIKRCVAVGLGWTVLPALTVEGEGRGRADGDLAVLDGPDLPACEVRVISHPRRHRGPEVEAVLTEIRRAWNAHRDPA